MRARYLAILCCFGLASLAMSVRGQGATADDTARFLAGLPASGDSPLAGRAAEDAWQNHARRFDTAWAGMESSRLSKIRPWAEGNLEGCRANAKTLYYMFAGPDFLYAGTLFPDASTYILCGLEPVGPIPDVARMDAAQVATGLRQIEVSLNSVLAFSFFKTKDMKTDLQAGSLDGTIPILWVFLARTGKTIESTRLVSLDTDGELLEPGTPATGKSIPGVQIGFTGAPGAALQTLYYFSTDISDDGLRANRGFLAFCRTFSPAVSFVKSASYLMHKPYFSGIRNFLLANSLAILQDDSGIPLAFFTREDWSVQPLGVYKGPIELFKECYQPDLAGLYDRSGSTPLPFGIGYRHQAAESTLLLATRVARRAIPVREAVPVTDEGTPNP